MKVKFLPQNIELEIQPNQSVKDLADKNGIFVKSICGGLPSCAECRIRLVEGEHNVLPPGTKELNLIGSGYFIDQRRLSCQLLCFGDISVDLTEQIEKEKNQGSDLKRPHGSRKTEEEKSYAVQGSLIQQEAELIQQAPRESTQAQNRGRDSRERDNRDNRDKRRHRRRR